MGSKNVGRNHNASLCPCAWYWNPTLRGCQVGSQAFRSWNNLLIWLIDCYSSWSEAGACLSGVAHPMLIIVFALRAGGKTGVIVVRSTQHSHFQNEVSRSFVTFKARRPALYLGKWFPDFCYRFFISVISGLSVANPRHSDDRHEDAAFRAVLQ